MINLNTTPFVKCMQVWRYLNRTLHYTIQRCSVSFHTSQLTFKQYCKYCFTLFVLINICVYILVQRSDDNTQLPLQSHHQHIIPQRGSIPQAPSRSTTAATPIYVVSYIYYETPDQQNTLIYRDNMRYFLTFGIGWRTQADIDADRTIYYITIQTNDFVTFNLYEWLYSEQYLNLGVVGWRQPSNVHFVLHPNICYDLGVHGWSLQHNAHAVIIDAQYNEITDLTDPYHCGTINETTHRTSTIEKFILMNVSVRGPFLPVPVQKFLQQYNYHWTDLLSTMITDRIKLVGLCLIRGYEWRHMRTQREFVQYTHNVVHFKEYYPTIQSSWLVLDWTTLHSIVSHSRAFSCHPTFNDAVLYGEIGLTLSVLQSGYNIGTVQQVFDNSIDWSIESNVGQIRYQCDKFERTYPNQLSQYEGMFLKMKLNYITYPVQKDMEMLSQWRYKQLYMELNGTAQYTIYHDIPVQDEWVD